MSNKVTVKFKKLDKDAKLFEYKSNGAAGADIYANTTTAVFPLKTKAVTMVPTGIAVEVPKGYEMQIRARSGLASQGIIVTNGVGTIDSDYRGEIKVLLSNISDTIFQINKYDRIAQAVLKKVETADFTEVESLSNTERNDNGFGSTGV